MVDRRLTRNFEKVFSRLTNNHPPIGGIDNTCMESNQEIKKVTFVCQKCGGELDVKENGYKYITENHQLMIGQITKKRKIFSAKCTQCNLTDTDYFKY